jgi:hypothetical protein
MGWHVLLLRRAPVTVSPVRAVLGSVALHYCDGPLGMFPAISGKQPDGVS